MPSILDFQSSENLPPEALSRCETMTKVGPYRGYSEIQAQIDEFAQRGARQSVLGRSVQGVDIPVLEVGPVDASTLRVVLAGVHAMEWVGVEVLMEALERLVSQPPQAHRVLVIPVLNVDGYQMVESDLRAGRRNFRRGNANGVDLNRNWPTHFKRRPGRTPLRKWLGNSGEFACSEPEVAAVEARLRQEIEKGAMVARALSLHSFGRVVLYPFGGRWAAPEARIRHVELAHGINQYLARKYRVVQCARWFPGFFAYGMELDHFHTAYGADSILVECSGGGMGWRRPSSLFHPFRWFNPPEFGEVVHELAPAVVSFCSSS